MSAGRYSDRRWRIRVRHICQQLGRYTYLDVSHELHDQAHPNHPLSDSNAPRATLGAHLPTDRQLQQYLARAEWSRVVLPGDSHTLTVYEFYLKYLENNYE